MRRWIALAGTVGAIVVLAVVLNHGIRPERPDEGNGAREGDGGQASEKGEIGGPVAARLPPTTGAILGVVRRGSRPATATIEVRRLRSRRPARGLLEPSFDAPRPDDVAAGEPDHRAETGEGGHYVVPGVGVGTFEVLARGADGAVDARQVTRIAAHERTAADLRLTDRPSTLRGVAVLADGTPWRREILLLGHPWRALGTPFRVRPDEDGRFAVAGLAPGDVWPAVRLDVDTLRLLGPVRVPAREPVRLIVDEDVVEVVGHVVADADGRPVAGAEVRVEGGNPRHCYIASWTRSSEDGSFRVLARRGVRLRVVAEGYGPEAVYWPGKPSEVEVRLRGEARLEGSCTLHPEGGPAGGFTVEVIREARPFELLARVRTGEDGGFELGGLPAGVVALRVSGRGRTAEGAADAEWDGYDPGAVKLEAGTTSRCDLRLVAAANVSGRVVDETGRGIPGAKVVARRSWYGGANPETVTGADGEFAFDGLAAGRIYSLSTRPPGRRRTDRDVLALAGESARVELRVPAPRWLEVVILDSETGEPVTGASFKGAGVEGETDRTGRAVLGPLSPGRSVVHVSHPEFLVPRVPIAVRESDGRRIRRKVRLVRGLAVAGRITLGGETPDEGVAGLIDPGRGRVEVDCDREGAFRVSGLPAGRYEIIAAAERGDLGGRTRVKAEAGSENLLIDIAPRKADEGRVPTPPTIRVIVRDEAGRPVLRGQVDEGDRMPGELGQGEGRIWRWEDDPPETLAVFGVRDAEGQRLEAAVVGPVSRGVVVVTLGPGRTLSGRVVGPDGEPVRGVLVEAVPRIETGREGDSFRPHDRAWTGPDGRFRLEGLGDPVYGLKCSLPRGFSLSDEVTARPGGGETVVRLGRAVDAVVTVLDPEGEPVPDAYCVVSRSPGREWDAYTDHTGRALLVGLDPGADGELTVWTQRPDLGTATLECWRPGPTTVRLGRLFAIRGVIRDPEGRPFPGARVAYTPVGSDHEDHEWSDEVGDFEIGGLQPGAFVLRAETAKRNIASAKVTVPAGTDGLVLVLDPGLDLTVVVNTAETVRFGLRAEGPEDWRCYSSTRGEMTFSEVVAGVPHEVLVGPTADGRWAHGEGLEAGRHELPLVEGKPLRGRVLTPVGATDPVVRLVRRGLRWTLDLDEGLAFSWDKAPPGPWVLRASATVRGAERTVEVPVDPDSGTEVVLDLR